jgi:hypothetical protein
MRPPALREYLFASHPKRNTSAKKDSCAYDSLVSRIYLVHMEILIHSCAQASRSANYWAGAFLGFFILVDFPSLPYRPFHVLVPTQILGYTSDSDPNPNHPEIFLFQQRDAQICSS